MLVMNVGVSLKMMRWILLLTVCSVLEIVGGNDGIRCIPKERQALLQFKASLFDPYGMLSSWNNTNVDCCQWKGIGCNNLTGHVFSLDLHGDTHYDGQVGDMDKSLMELQQLQYLNLSGNHFQYRNIPHFFASLANLRSLDLSDSYFGGNILSQLGSLSHLKYLNLAWNYLHGSIPYQLANLSNLQYLDIWGNSLEGKIPSQLGNLSKLQYLDLRFNYLKGKIPSQLGKLSNMQTLSLGGLGYGLYGALKIDDGNHMRGQWLSNLTSLTHLSLWSISDLNSSHSSIQMIANLPKLRELSLRDCSLSDHFILSLRPFKFNFSTSLSVLDLSANTFTSSMILEWVSNVTSNLVQLHLRGNYLEGFISPDHFGLVMNSLDRLDLSFNGFNGGILNSLVNICTLHSLNMYDNNLAQDLWTIFHNLSRGCIKYSLQELDLGYNQIIGTLPNLSAFSSLKRLHLYGNQLSGKIPEDARLPPQLEVLSIQSNTLEGGVPKSFGGSCTLETLDLSYNSFNEELTMIFNHLSGCSRYSLRELCLDGNKINGTLSNLSMFPKLESLSLSSNQVNLPESNTLSFPNESKLWYLDLSNNSFSGDLLAIIHHFPRQVRYSLKELDLSMNQISGPLPDLLFMFPSLKKLQLYGNKLNGTISKELRFLTELEELDLSSNFLKGVITDSHFVNMSKLYYLDLSDNSLTLAFPQNWIPPFQLRHIGLRSCKLGPTFPMWLQVQNNFEDLDISNNGISGIVPKWFWAKLASQEWETVNISYNTLYGIIPNFPLKNFHFSLTLESNQFEGHIPSFLQGVILLNLSKNKFSNSHSFLCANGTIENLHQLDLSNNQLSGQIPNCWSHFKSLIYLDLSHNTFSGKIPTSMGSLRDLQALFLRNNNLTNDISFSLRNCTELVMLDMAENRLSGPIPAWIGSELQNLEILSLRRNHLFGSLPLQICYLKNIQILDLSQNNLSGQISKCIENFTSMALKNSSRVYQGHEYYYTINRGSGREPYDLNVLLMWKGSEQMFKNEESLLLKSIDLSSNHFSGEIPIEIENLFELVSLNLSRNNLIGKFPSNIGKLASLEFLDLSRNQLIGSIPSSLAQIDRLAMLDLSHNHLSGEIPTGTQLQSFNASCYEDNFDLCGPPLEKLCFDGKPIVKLDEDEYLLLGPEFYMSMAFGFAIGFWGVFGSLLAKRSWRHAYFKFLNKLANIVHI